MAGSHACPLLDRGEPVECLRETCAWFIVPDNPGEGRCAVRALSNNLGQLAGDLNFVIQIAKAQGALPNDPSIPPPKSGKLSMN